MIEQKVLAMRKTLSSCWCWVDLTLINRIRRRIFLWRKYPMSEGKRRKTKLDRTIVRKTIVFQIVDFYLIVKGKAKTMRPLRLLFPPSNNIFFSNKTIKHFLFVLISTCFVNHNNELWCIQDNINRFNESMICAFEWQEEYLIKMTFGLWHCITSFLISWEFNEMTASPDGSP